MLPTLLRDIWIWEVENADIGLWFYAQRTCPFEWFQLQSDYSHIMEGNLISAPSKSFQSKYRSYFYKTCLKCLHVCNLCSAPASPLCPTKSLSQFIRAARQRDASDTAPCEGTAFMSDSCDS